MTAPIQPIEQAREPHATAKEFLERRRESPSFGSRPLTEIREERRQQALASEDPEPVGDVADVVVRTNGHAIPVRVYTPSGDGPFPVLVWAHGGGFVLGDVETEDATARAMTNALGCVVVSVEYRLAPEHPFPAALKDVYAAVEWAAESAGAFGGDTDEVVVGGQSAGGNLAAATALLSRDRDGPTISSQVLVVPAVNYSREFPADEEDADVGEGDDSVDGDGDDSDEGDDANGSRYLSDPLYGHNPYAYPLEASDFADLPPATVVTAGHDDRRYEGRAYAEELHQAGTPVSHHHYPDTIHFFFGQFPDPAWERAYEALEDIAADLEARLESGRSGET